MVEFDTDEWRKKRDELLCEWVGDRDAIEFVLTVFNTAEFFDDLIDGDKEIDKQMAVHVLFDLAVAFPLNPFFEKYKLQLIPVIIVGLNGWLDANSLEGGTDNDKAMAYVLRDLYMEVLSMVIYLTRGQAFLRKHSVEIRKFFTRHESLEEYMRKLQ